jgi:hypothetical protein
MHSQYKACKFRYKFALFLSNLKCYKNLKHTNVAVSGEEQGSNFKQGPSTALEVLKRKRKKVKD